MVVGIYKIELKVRTSRPSPAEALQFLNLQNRIERGISGDLTKSIVEVAENLQNRIERLNNILKQLILLRLILQGIYKIELKVTTYGGPTTHLSDFFMNLQNRIESRTPSCHDYQLFSVRVNLQNRIESHPPSG